MPIPPIPYLPHRNSGYSELRASVHRRWSETKRWKSSIALRGPGSPQGTRRREMAGARARLAVRGAARTGQERRSPRGPRAAAAGRRHFGRSWSRSSYTDSQPLRRAASRLCRATIADAHRVLAADVRIHSVLGFEMADGGGAHRVTWRRPPWPAPRCP